MATLRPLKEGSVRTYQEKVALGFPDILASEMDADLDTIYAAWNGTAGGDLQGNYPNPTIIPAARSKWTVVGATLQPTDTSKQVQVPAQFIVQPTTAADSLVLFNQNTGTNRGQVGYQSSSNAIMFYQAAGGNALLLNIDGSLQYTNNVTLKPSGGAWQATSDARIKTVLGDYTQGLREVTQLQPVAYAYRGNDTPSDDVHASLDPNASKATEAPYPASPHYGVAKAGKQFVGLVAQDVEAIFPGMVTTRPGFIDGLPVADLRDLDTSPLIYALVNAVKDLAARLTALEAR